MFTVPVKPEIIRHCKQQLEKYNFGKRGIADGTPEQQLTGIIGQSVVLDLFNMPWVDGKDGFDEGIDLVYHGLSIDVKTMGRTTGVRYYYVNNFIGLQKDYHVDTYIFGSLNKKTNEFTVIGWLPKNELLKRASFYEKGSVRKRSDGTTFETFADLYEIENRKLFWVSSFDDLTKQLDRYILKKVKRTGG
ncbi:MAG: hypothetical protein GXO86_11900, partial [Chlorobi bacterium]|nr:hypothetical protein [Chlorobiota bacterium]